MFEKEADEYAGENWQMIHRYQTNDRLAREQSFKDGAEFGYNKANEWHYIKDGDLPKNNTQVLVLLENKRMKVSIFMENKFTVWNKDYNAYTKLYNVIAWKEIELPELPKESK